MFEQPEVEEQSCHWYANKVGLPFHDPADAVSANPCCAVPLIAGNAAFTGGGGSTVLAGVPDPCGFVGVPDPGETGLGPEVRNGLITAVGGEVAEFSPHALLATTFTRIVWPTSFAGTM
jgi:hypothetical protein